MAASFRHGAVFQTPIKAISSIDDITKLSFKKIGVFMMPGWLVPRG